MPPRLELMIMRTLQISYVEARDLVQEGRNVLNMKFTDPWDDKLKEQCELIHKTRGGSIVKQQQQQQDEKGEEQVTVTATAAATCSSSTIHDDTNNENDNVDISTSNNKENTTVKNVPKNNSNSSSNKSSSTDDDDDDDDDDESDSLSMTREELMKRQSPSKASLYATLGDSLWVIQSSNDHISASNHSDDDEDNLNSKDNDDDEKLLHQTITIKTKPKTPQQQSQHSNYSGSCRDIKNNPKVTPPQSTIPKFVYVITLNDVPIELLLEEAKRKSIHLRGSHSNDDKNANEGRRSRSRSIGRKNNTNNSNTKKDTGNTNNMFRRGRSLSRHRKNSAGDGADAEQCTDECTDTPKSSSTKSSNSSGNVDRPQRRRSLSRGKKMIMDKLQSFRKNTNTTKNGAPVIDIDMDLDDDDDDDDEKQ